MIKLKQISNWLASKGLGTADARKDATQEQYAQVAKDFREEFGEELADAIAAAKQEPAEDVEAVRAAVEELDSILVDVSPEGEEEEPEEEEEPTASHEEEEPVAKSKKVVKTLTRAKKTIETERSARKKAEEEVQTLGKEVETPNPKKVEAPKKVIALGGPGTDDKYLFGIQDDMFLLSKPWNVNAAHLAKRNSEYRDKEKSKLRNEFNTYAESFSDRYNLLFTTGQLGTLLAAGDLDYTDLETDLGAYYRTRRQDALISFILKQPSVSSIFPVRYNVQDEEVITNSFQSRSYSQSFQSGRIFAGSFKFQPDKAKVKDVMFKYLFDNLKDLEHEYIGYLNKSGSDPIKWSFIEWILKECSLILMNEKEDRRVKGIRVEPTTGKASYYMYGSDGVLTTLFKKAEHYNQVYVFDDLKAYTDATIGDVAKELVKRVFRMRNGNLNNMMLCMNALDGPAFLEWYRTNYAKDMNYTGDKMEVKDFPLPVSNIKLVPNMGDRKDMWIQPVDMVEIQENVPGELFNFAFQRDIEQLITMSYGKEGTFAFAGRKFASKADLVASKGRHTNIFMINPVTQLAADVTTADATVNEMFITQANTVATAFTDFTGAVEGVAYVLKNGSTTNATTVAKAAKFANITAAYTPTSVGDYLKVIYNPTTDTYIEIERKVGGVLTENAAALAPEYVESI